MAVNVLSKTRLAKGSFVILNDRGLHTRPSTEIVKNASAFNSEIQLTCQNGVANAKSLLGILLLAAPKGAKILVTAAGEDAEEAVASLIDLAAEQFHIQY